MTKVGLAMLVAVMAMVPFAYADGVIVPGSIKVGQFKKLMMEEGLDLYGHDDSDGLVEQGGTRIKVVTYQPVTPEQLDKIKEAAMKSLRK